MLPLVVGFSTSVFCKIVLEYLTFTKGECPKNFWFIFATESYFGSKNIESIFYERIWVPEERIVGGNVEKLIPFDIPVLTLPE